MKYIMVSKVYPAYHPKAGQPTGFRDAILSGRKIHTLRQSAGNRATGDVVSLREWEGRPYASRQVEFARCRIDVQTMKVIGTRHDQYTRVVAKHDGFDDPVDFVNWFTKGKSPVVVFSGVCIYFLDVKQVQP